MHPTVEVTVRFGANFCIEGIVRSCPTILIAWAERHRHVEKLGHALTPAAHFMRDIAKAALQSVD
jgi:hypothetical protein